jgi:putative ABC transport system ATP-binding protein
MPANQDSPTPQPESPSTHPLEPRRMLGLLSHLADLTGVAYDGEHAKMVLNRLSSGKTEPLERLQILAAECCMSLHPMRVSVSSALWMARNEQPLVAWCEGKQDWLVIQRHGIFRAHLSTPSKPLSRRSVTRAELAAHLGVKNMKEVYEFGLVLGERPTEGVRGGKAEHASSLLPAFHIHGHDEHDHPSPARRFIGLMRPEMKDVWTMVIFSVVTGLLYLALPLAVNALVSNLAFGGQSGPFLQALLVLALALFVCLTLSATIRFLQYCVVEVIQRRLFVRLAADLTYRLPRVKAASLDGIHAPEMVNRFLDVVTVQKGTALILLDGVNAVLSAVIGMFVLGFYHPFLLAFVLVLITTLAVVVLVLGRKAVTTSIDESRGKYEIVNWLEELARYPRLFKGPGGYALASDRADTLARNYLHARRSHFRVLMRQITGLLVMEVIASAALLIVGGWLVISQQLTLGQLVASELIVAAIVASISKLAKQFEAWYDMMAAMDKIGHLVDIDIEREDGGIPTVNSDGADLHVSAISFGYNSHSPVFSGIDFKMKSGERVALQGTQGSGTSTLLDLLLGLRVPDSGNILMDGLDLRSWSLEALREQVMLLRGHDIVNGTILDNIRLGRTEIGLDDVNESLRAVGLLDEILAMPDGLKTPLITGGLPLSSRQRTRLLLARALAMKPRLLLLDDVFDGLDQDSLRQLTEPVFDAQRTWTLIIATRHPEVAAKCDRTIELKPEVTRQAH